MVHNKFSRKLILFSLVFCLIGSMVAFGCDQTPPAVPTTVIPSGPQSGGVLKIAAANCGANIGCPFALPQMDGAGFIYTGACLETFFTFDQTGKLAPGLAIGYEVAKDLKSVTVALRKGVKFHDGIDWNAQTAKWNLEKQRIGAGSTVFKVIQSIDIIDDYNIRINFSGWDNGIINNMGVYYGQVISPKAYDTYGEQWCLSNPVGTGPFKFVKWEKDVKIVYQRFDGYWQKDKPYLDGIEWNFIADPTTRGISFTSREVDVNHNVDPVLLPKGDYITSKTTTMFMAISGDSINASSPFANLKVRQAMEYAIDKQIIAGGIGAGSLAPIWQPARPGSWAENPNVTGYLYNVSKAKQLLAEAGYPNGFNTKFYVPNIQLFPDLSVAIQGYLKTVGITVNIESMTVAAWAQAAVFNPWKDGLTFITMSVMFPDESILLKNLQGPNHPMYRGMAVPSEVENLLVQAAAAPDFTSQKTLTQQLMKSEVDNCVVNWLFCGQGFTVSHPNIHNHGLYGGRGPFAWTPADAWMGKK